MIFAYVMHKTVVIYSVFKKMSKCSRSCICDQGDVENGFAKILAKFCFLFAIPQLHSVSGFPLSLSGPLSYV